MDPFARWVAEHAAPLRGTDPDGDLDDLEPLREVVGHARVVGIGEGAHCVGEFAALRRRVLRFLSERCGFAAVAVEFGFAEAEPLDRWVRGVDDEHTGPRGTSASGVTWEFARWLREHNTGSRPLRLLGLDVPVAGGSLRPALEPVLELLERVDAELVPLAQRASALSDRIASRSGAAAGPRWGELDTADQDALTASLSRLRLRMRALQPHYLASSDQHSYDRALHCLEAACHADYMFGATRDLFSGGSLAGDTTVRELYLAESLRWHLDRLPAGTRTALVAHNNHLQRTPLRLGGQLLTLPLGLHLQRMLGDDYRAIALTHTAEHVPEMLPHRRDDLGYDVVDTALPEPGSGSVEAGLVAAGLGATPSALDLRRARQELPAGQLPQRMRSQSELLELPVAEDFDGLLATPSVTVVEE